MPNHAQIDVAAVRDWLGDGGEIAFLDVREEGKHGAGHPLLAVNLPYSRLELDIGRLVPRRACRVVLIDGGDGVADRAARRLAGLGYSAMQCRRGRRAAWEREGHKLFPSTNVPSKAFAEIVEIDRHTPHVTAAELDRIRREGTKVGGARQPHGRGVQPLSCARRGELPRRRAGASLHRSGARPGYARRRLLRRAHPQHHRGAVADKRRRAEQGRLVAGRDAGLAARRAGAGARYRGLAGAGQQGGGRGGAQARGRCHQALRHQADRSRDAGLLARRERARTTYVLDVRTPGRVRGRASAGIGLGRGRAAGAGDRSLGRHKRRPPRAGGRYRDARDHDRPLADADGLGCGRARPGLRRARVSKPASPSRSRPSPTCR